MTIPVPARLTLAHLPTPLHRLPRLSDRLGVDLWIKRDDLTNGHTGGNKLRKLEFLLAEAVSLGATHVITCGGIQSNHARATALAARPLGMTPILVLRTPNGLAGDLPPEPTGNLLLDAIAGADVRTIDPVAYRERRGAVMAEIAAQLTRDGARPYIVPEGGSSALGAFGYASVIPELLAAMPDGAPDTIIAATGSGGTLAGLALGIAQAAVKTRAVGVAVCDDAPYFERIVHRIIAEAVSRYGAVPADSRHFEVLEGFQGTGYALTTPCEIAFLKETARLDGLVLDPVYTNKAFLALVRTLEDAPGRFGKRVVFIHTGGIYGLFAHSAALTA